jgi:hypothetical protein
MRASVDIGVTGVAGVVELCRLGFCGQVTTVPGGTV